MNAALVRELFEQIDTLPIIDIHTHVQWQTGTAGSIGDILSYHYYTELVNSAAYQEGHLPLGDPEALTGALWQHLPLIRNTVQYDWLMTISRELLGLDPWDWEGEDWRLVYERSLEVMGRPEWREQVIAQSNLTRVFLTNQYDDDLEGLDTSFYSPCLRTEPFVLGIEQTSEREGLARFLGRELRAAADVSEALEQAFARFKQHRMGYAAISAPANLQTQPISDEDAERLFARLRETGLTPEGRSAWRAWALEQVAAACRRHHVPFHLMAGVDRAVYAQGVPSGQDLFGSINALRGYDHLFNAYPDVRFPVAVLSDTTGLELTAAAWIRHNVYPSGHWWYANQPTEIGRELRRRLDTVPHNKTLGYFSDAYYLEFILPKFRMFKFELAQALAERMERSLIHPNMEPFDMLDAMDLAEDLLIYNPIEIMGLDAAE